MIFHRKPKNLTQWLNIATRSLVWFEAEKIAREIKGYFEDELEAQLQLGVSQSDAEKLALATLGDPLKAHGLFQKVHLTKVEWEDYISHQPNAECHETGVYSSEFLRVEFWCKTNVYSSRIKNRVC